jgi:RHS repeat-associated protein
MTLVVNAMYTDSVTVADTVNTEVMVVNEGSSTIATGWSVGGLQRLYVQYSGYLISEGDGTAVRFASLGSVAPDFSVLTYSSGVYTRTYPNGTRALFSYWGYLMYIIDAQGGTTTFEYDPYTRLSRIKDPMASAGSGAPYDSLTYGATGLASIIEKTASTTLRTTNVTIGTNGSISGIEDPDGVSTSFTYDGDKKLSTITDRKGATTTLAYDTLTWKLASITMPMVAMDAGSGSTSNTNPVATYAAWQGVGLPRSGTSAGSPAAAPIPDTIVGRITDPVSHVSKYTVNRYGQPMVATNALSQTTTFLRTGFLAYEIDQADGSVDKYGYDAAGGLIMSLPAGGDTTHYVLKGPYGQVDTVWVNNTLAQVMKFNSDSLVSRIEIPGDGVAPLAVTKFTYDATTKRVASEADTSGHTSLFYYDSVFGNTRRTITPRGTDLTTVFDRFGRDSTSGATGLSTGTTVFDALNRATDAYDGVNTYAMRVRFDQLDDTAVVDKLGNTYKQTHNALGWVTQSCDASSNCSTLRYDASGALASITNRRGQRIDLTRDALGRVTAKTGSNTSSDSFSYASNGHDFVASNSVETDSVFVNPGNATTPAADSVVTWIGSKMFKISHHGHLGVAGNNTTTISSNTGVTFPARIDSIGASGNLEALGFAGTLATIGFNGDDVADSTFFAPGFARADLHTTSHALSESSYDVPVLDTTFQRSYSYDASQRVNGVYTPISGGNYSERKIGYDQLGHVVADSIHNSCGSAAPDSVTGETMTCMSLTWTAGFAYDAMGNRTDHSASIGTGNRPSAYNGESISYDADGNITQKYKSGSYNHEYYWSAESRLDSAVLDSWGMVKYGYNAFGRPVIKYRRDPTEGWYVDSYFLWDGDELVADFDSAGHRRAEYMYYPGIDQPFAENLGATTVTATRYQQQDATGNVIGTVDGTSVSQNVSYDAWGTPTVTGNWDNRLLWKGLMWEGDAVSLYYVRNRWYDPELGRFMSEDPAGFSGGDNLYAFAGDDPINGSDPSGMDPDCRPVYGYEDSGYTIGNLTVTVATRVIVGWTCRGSGPVPGGAGGMNGSDGFDANAAAAAIQQISKKMQAPNKILQCFDAGLYLGVNMVSDYLGMGALGSLATSAWSWAEAGDDVWRFAWRDSHGVPSQPELTAALARRSAARSLTAGAAARVGVNSLQSNASSFGGGQKPRITDWLPVQSPRALQDGMNRCANANARR